MTRKTDALVEGWERDGLMTMLDRWADDDAYYAAAYAERWANVRLLDDASQDAPAEARERARRNQSKTILHRTEDRRPIATIPPETWVWDDRNDEPALFHGWSRVSGCYIATWPSLEQDGHGGDFCLFDLDGNGRPVALEVLRVESANDWRCPTCGGGDIHSFGCATRSESTYRTGTEQR